jgi:hypothetical protein
MPPGVDSQESSHDDGTAEFSRQGFQPRRDGTTWSSANARAEGVGVRSVMALIAFRHQALSALSLESAGRTSMSARARIACHAGRTIRGSTPKARTFVAASPLHDGAP